MSRPIHRRRDIRPVIPQDEVKMSTTTTNRLALRYRAVRSLSDAISGPLSAEDCMVQSMPDVSPTRWHLAHTTWFFETFLLRRNESYEVFDDQFQYLFNSYYNAVGKQFPRPQRGLISRPGLNEIREYRAYVDSQMESFLLRELDASTQRIVNVGIHHEQQHQELMLTDIKHVLSCNPLLPAYHDNEFELPAETQLEWVPFSGGTRSIGHDQLTFCYDNELPVHAALLHDFQIASRPVTCGEYIQFIEDGGYNRPDHWLSMGWSTVNELGWDAPLYWLKKGGAWFVYTLAGLVPIDEAWPVCHVSYFEADAFARWSGARLPTEFEWEVAASEQPIEGQFADHCLATDRAVHPTLPARRNAAPGCPQHLFGGVWEWTQSSYAPYPGYCPPDGALGEYNGKFMCNQYVLRGGSVATSWDHIRPTYRNFFPPEARWQFSGVRLAR